MRYFIIEGKKIGISKLWTRGAIWFFLIIVILGYVTTVYLLCRVIMLQSLLALITNTIGGNCIERKVQFKIGIYI